MGNYWMTIRKGGYSHLKEEDLDHTVWRAALEGALDLS